MRRHSCREEWGWVRAQGFTASLLSALVLTACGGPGASGGESTSLPTSPAERAETRKLTAPSELTAELEASGATVLADYGSFKLWQAPPEVAKASSAKPGVALRDDLNQILLSAGTLDTLHPSVQALAGVPLPEKGKRLQLVQFVGPIQGEWYKALEATGVRIVTYIPNDAYLVYGDAAQLNELKRLNDGMAAVQWSGAYLDDYKLHASLSKLNTQTFALQLVEDPEANAETLALVRSLQRREVSVQSALGYLNIVTELDRSLLGQLVTRPDVVSIQARPEPRLVDERQNMIISGNLTGNQPTGPGYLAWLTSKGFAQSQFTLSNLGVDVSDSGLDNATLTPNHFGLYVGGKVANASRVAYARLQGTPNGGSTLQGCDGHGTLNSHIIGGYVDSAATAPHVDGAGYRFGLGVAPFVRVGSSVIFDPGSFTNPDYEDLQSRAYQDGMRVSSNSWGAASGGAYTSDSQRYDALVRDAQPASAAVPAAGNQEMIILFAAGNSGSGANTVGSPGTGKNVFTIGASEGVQAFGAADQCGVADAAADGAFDIATFSSRGPTDDTRKKPDLMAPGTHISGGVFQVDGQRADPPGNVNGQAAGCFNATGVCAGPGSSNFFPTTQQWYTASSGTSHSTPAVAGAAALTYQYFLNQSLSAPSPAMVKAYLMNSTRYMTGTGANDNLFSNNQGMGLLDLGMAFDGTARLLNDQAAANKFTATGQTRTFNGVVGDSAKPFRVTLAWTDAPGSTTGNAYNNNLDLTVTVGGNTYLGNVFTGANSVTGGTADVANNVESVFLPAGVSGPYTITVTAANINSDGVPGDAAALDQDFALVAFNSCNTAPAALTDVAATVNGNNRVDITWTNNGAQGYHVYRSTTAGGPYTQVGNVASSPFADTTVSGGTTYFYVVRGVDCAESPNSNESSVTATGNCTLPPTFAGLTSASSAGSATCGANLSWSAATPMCGGTITYSVHRSTTPGFVPSNGNRIATGVSGTSFLDDLNLSSHTTYYYVVRATETAAASSTETNTVQRSAFVGGAGTVAINYFDDFDGNRPPNAASYWIESETPGNNLNLTSNCHYQSATQSYRFGAANANCGGTYASSSNSTLSLGGNGTTAGINGFAIPANPTSATLSVNLWYQLENNWDGAYLAYSTTAATGPWTGIGDSVVVGQPYITAGGYDNVIRNGTQRVWTGANQGANGALKAVTVNLAALGGQTVWFAFRFTSDSSVNQEGIYLDNVGINVQTVASCTTNTPPPGPAVAYRIDNLAASVQAGVAELFDLTALDALGQVATSYAGSANVTSNDPQAVLPGPVTFANGVASGVSVTLGTLGARSVTATDTLDNTITGSGSTTVTAGPPHHLVFFAQPPNATAGVAMSPPPSVRIVDAFGNLVGSATDSITVAIANNAGGGTLSGTATVAAVGGTATFPGLSIEKSGTGYTLGASSGSLVGATSSAFNVTAAAPAKLFFSVQPSNGTAGAALAPAVVVNLLDAFDNQTGATSTVSLALSGGTGGAVLGGTSSVAAVAGVATFSNLTVDRVGTGYQLGATAPSVTGATSTAFNISPNVPYRARFTVQPSNVVAGATLAPAVQVTLYDQWGNLATQSSMGVTVSLGNNPGASTLGGTLTVNASAGVATFSDLSLNRVGNNYTLNAGASGLYADTSTGFDVAAGAAARVAFAVQPTDTSAGASLSPAVQVAVQDAHGNLVTGGSVNVTVALGANPGTGTLSGTTTQASAGGIATFSNLSIDKAASGYVLSATAPSLLSGSSTAFAVLPSTATQLAFIVQPSTAAAGASLSPVVQVAVQDASGNTVTGYAGSITVAFGANPGGGALAGTTTVPVSGGVASFGSLSVDKVATGYTLSATSGTLTPATSMAFDIVPGAVSKLAFVAQPSNAVAGAPLGSVSVELLDGSGNRVTTFAGDVTLALGVNPTGAALSGPSTVAAVNGLATFSGLSVKKVGAGYTLMPFGAGVTGVNSAAFSIGAGPAASLQLSGFPASVTAGQEVSFEVSAWDAFGNAASSYAGTAAVTTSDPQVASAANVELTAGKGTGKVTFKSSGLRTLTVTSSTDVAVTGTAQLNVTPFGLPQVSVSGVASGEVVSGKVALTATATVAAGTSLATLSLLVDGVVVATAAEPTVTFTWDTAALPNGSTHVITAVASDAAGSVSSSAPIAVVVRQTGCGCSSNGDVSALFGVLALAHFVRRRRPVSALRSKR